MPEATGLLTGREEMCAHLLQMVQAAQLELNLHTHELDHRLYGSEAFVEALKNFLLSGPKAKLRLLVESPQTATRGNARMVELLRRLSSRVEIRQLPDERKPTRDDCLVADRRHIFQRKDPGDIEARYFQDAPLRAQDLLKAFDEVWNEATVAREFTDLKL